MCMDLMVRREIHHIIFCFVSTSVLVRGMHQACTDKRVDMHVRGGLGGAATHMFDVFFSKRILGEAWPQVVIIKRADLQVQGGREGRYHTQAFI